ncbi:MAG: ABC transporter substrate-binding protein [Bacteroidales bacterium]
MNLHRLFKQFIIPLPLMLSVFLLTGISSCKKDSDNKVRLTFTSWRIDDVARMNRINELYLKTHPDIEINFEPYDPVPYDSITLDHLTNNSGADIIFLRPYEVGQKYYDQGYLYDLTNVIPYLSSYNPLMVKAWTTDQGVTYGLPSVGVTHGIYYNKEIFAAHSIAEPASWADFIAACEILKIAGITPIAQGAVDEWTLYEVVFSGLGANFYGGEIARQALMAGTNKLTDANFLTAFNIVYSLKNYIPSNFATLGYEASRQLFASGNAALFIGGSWEISVFNELGMSSAKLGWFAPPVPNTGDKLQYCFHVDAGIGVNKNSKHLNEALEYLKWLAGPEYAQALMDELPGFFSYTSPSQVTINNSLAAKMHDASANADLTVRTMCEKLSAQEPSGNKLMGTALAGMLKGTYSPNAAAAYVQTQLDTWYHP